MRPLLALIRREFTGYFLSPVGYVTLCFFLVVTGLLFAGAVGGLTRTGAQGVEYPFTALLGDSVFWFVFAFIPPLLTMRLISEERANGTLEALLTAPIRDWQVVAGKFIAAVLFYLVLWLPTLAYLPVLLNVSVGPLEHVLLDPWFQVLVHLVGLLLYAVVGLVGPGGWGRVLLLTLLNLMHVGVSATVGWVAAGPLGALVSGGLVLGVLAVFQWLPAFVAWLVTRDPELTGAWWTVVYVPVQVVAYVVVAVALPHLLLPAPLPDYPTGLHFGVDPSHAVCSYLGVLLAGMMFLAVGLFVSSLVKNQLIAAMISLAVCLVFVVAEYAQDFLNANSWQANAVRFVSVPDHFRRDFTRGVIDTRPVVLYLSVTACCLFLTVRSLEARRLRA